MMRLLRLSLALGILLAVTACASQNSDIGGGSGAAPNSSGAANGGGAANSGSSSASGSAASSSFLPRPTGGAPTQDNQAAPDARAVNLRPAKWARAEAGAGRQLVVHYTATGTAECNLLGRVDVAETAHAVTVTVLLGWAPGADCGGAQPMLAAQFVTTVTLSEPLGARTVVDGAS
jgi:hypothetical protein